jgi:hypothetical protein
MRPDTAATDAWFRTPAPRMLALFPNATMNFDSPLTRPKPKASRRGWLQDGKQHERHEGTHRVRVVEADVAVAVSTKEKWDRYLCCFIF